VVLAVEGFVLWTVSPREGMPLRAFASLGQILPHASFVQLQIGTDQPTSTDRAPRTLFWRLAAGHSLRQERGLGRIWSPMVELVGDRDFEEGASTSVDVVPQMQVSLNRRQHVRVNVGLQLPDVAEQARRAGHVFDALQRQPQPRTRRAAHQA
jgi:hypothetical protein